MNHPAVRDGALLVLRLALGFGLIAHGWDKLFITGLNGSEGTIATFQHLGVPQPSLSAWIASITEVFGGGLLVVGLLTPAVAAIVALEMLAALYFAHLGKGFFVRDGGVELPLLYIVALQVIVVFGPGRASLDRAFARFT